MFKFSPFLIALALQMLIHSQSRSEVLLSCAEPRGKIFVIGQGQFDDGFSGGNFQLVRDGANFDIFINDVSGTRSARADGATVVATEMSEGAMTILAAYPKALETFLFDISSKTMLMTSMKISTGPRRAGIYLAECE
jgi:hypothetical protein